MTRVKIDINEMQRQSSRIDSINSTFYDDSNKIITNATNFYNNVEGTGKNSLNIQSFNTNIKNQSRIIVDDFKKIKSFIDKQMEGYEREAKSANDMVNDLISSLKSCVVEL